jgi:tetratricopeptide (TPR) repeat protein
VNEAKSEEASSVTGGRLKRSRVGHRYRNQDRESEDLARLIDLNLQFVDLKEVVKLGEALRELQPQDWRVRAVKEAALAGLCLHTWDDVEAARLIEGGLRFLTDRVVEKDPPMALSTRGILLKRRGELERNAGRLLRAEGAFIRGREALAAAAGDSRWSDYPELRGRAKAAEGATMLLLSEVFGQRGETARSEVSVGRSIATLTESAGLLGPESGERASSLADRAIAYMRLAELQQRTSGLDDSLVSYSAALASVSAAVAIRGGAGRLYHTRARVLTSRGWVLALGSGWAEAARDFAAAEVDLKIAFSSLHRSPAVLLNHARLHLRRAEAAALACDWKAGTRAVEGAVRILAPLVATSSTKPEYPDLLAGSRLLESRLARESGNRAAATRLCTEAERWLSEARSRGPTFVPTLLHTAKSAVERVLLDPELLSKGRPHRLLEIREKVADLVPTSARNPEFLDALAEIDAAIGHRVLATGQNLGAAIDQFRRAAEGARLALRRWPADLGTLVDCASYLLDASDIQRATGAQSAARIRVRDARSLLERALAFSPRHLPGLRQHVRCLLASRTRRRPESNAARRELELITALAPHDRASVRLHQELDSKNPT